MRKPKASLALSTILAGALLLSQSAFSDQTVRIPSNQNTLTLQLKANPSTGYQWFLENYNSTYFTYLGYHYLAPQSNDTAGKMTGVPGMAQFTFQVNPAFHQAPLVSKIHLIYARAWNMDADATDTVVTLISLPSNELPEANTEDNPTSSPETATAPALPHDLSEDTPPPDMLTVSNTPWLSLPKNQAQS